MRQGLFSAKILTVVTFFLVLSDVAYSRPQYRVFNECALAAKKPEQDVLVGIARAGNRVVAVGEHGIIIYSDNDGQSWRQAAVPVDLTLTTVAFATPHDGWAAGALGVVLHTTDGGETWKVQITGVQVNQLIVAAANQFAASYPTGPTVPRALHRASMFMQDGPDKPFLSILPFDVNNVQIFGAYRMCIKTKDAGTSWQDCSLNVPDSISHNLYDAVQSGSSVYLAGESGSVFRSDDRGNTFSALTAPADNTLFGILVTPTHALLTYGVAGGLFKSIDRGQTWTQAKIGSQSDLTAGIILKSGRIFLLDETGSVYLSSDDGASFRPVRIQEGMALYDAVQASNGDVLLVGSGGVRVLSFALLN